MIPIQATSTRRPPEEINPRTDPPLDFVDKPMAEMTPADYDKLGLMCGLEVHQQLMTTSKLFCRCPAGVRTTKCDAEVLRHMRPTLSELGEYDGTALMEFKTRKKILYRIERESVCTYELDDTPPFPIDEEAVRIAIEVARFFNLNLVSELHVMRKQYLDGSIPTGFQRTAMIGLTGTIPFGDGDLRIRQLSLEEDSCREISDVGHRIEFRTDRLGMPLIETVTEPDLVTPQQVKRAIDLIARVARSSGKMRRGAGAARQDVNVSVAGGRRIEIKGVPQSTLVPLLVHNEAFRQLNLLRVRATLIERKVQRDALEIPWEGEPWDITNLVALVGSLGGMTPYSPIQKALDCGKTMCAIRIPHFEGLLSHPVQPGKTLASEFADRLRVIACLTGAEFMLDSDTDTELGAQAWSHIRAMTDGTLEDSFIVCWGDREDVATAAREVLFRAQEAIDGVPPETRQPFPDGTTGLERILPGPDRMYPDTDTPPLAIPDAWVEHADATRPELPWQRAARYADFGLPEDDITRLEDAPWRALFDSLAIKDNAIAKTVSFALQKRLVHRFRQVGLRQLPELNTLTKLVALLSAGHPHGHFEWLLDQALESEDTVTDLIDTYRSSRASAEDIEATAAQVATRLAEVRSQVPAARLRWAMGEAMADLRGRADANAVRTALVSKMPCQRSGDEVEHAAS